MPAKSLNLLLAALCLVALSACSTPRGAALQSEVLREADKETPTFQVVAVSRAEVPKIAKWPRTGGRAGHSWIPHERGPSSQIIRTGDLVTLTIWDNQENSLLTAADQKFVQLPNLQVSAAGTIFVPYIEEIVVRGLTEAQARERIQSKLEVIVPAAQVQLAARQGRQNSVSVLGAVGAPGSQSLDTRGVTVLDVIASAGGISSELNYPVVRLNRGSSSYTIPVEALYATPAANTIVRGGDRIIVEPEKRTFTALGATGRENLITFPKENLTALEAISLSGGINDGRANPKGILILREYSRGQLRGDSRGPSMQQVIFTLDLTSADGLFAARNFRVNPGDTVLATESPVTTARTILGLFGSVLGLTIQAGNAVN